jgi:hypothetical protein
MNNHTTTTRTGTLPAPRQHIVRDRQGLFDAHSVIDRVGGGAAAAVRPTPSIRSIARGIVWQTARRALLSEILTASCGTDARRAREHDAEDRAGTWVCPVSLDPLLELGREPCRHVSTDRPAMFSNMSSPAARERRRTPSVTGHMGLDRPSRAYPNAYPNANRSAHVRGNPGPSSRGSDLHRRTQADLGERASGP